MATVRKRTRIAAGGQEKTVWIADYVDQHRKRHIKTFVSQKTAAAWLIETQGEVARGIHTAERGSITVTQAAQLWLERGIAEQLEPSTMRNYQTLVRLHIIPTLGNVKLARLSVPLLEDWRTRLLVRLSRSRARKVLWILKAILAEAQKRGRVAQNTALPVKIETRQRDQRKVEIGVDIPAKADIQKLLAGAAARPEWRGYRALLITAVLTGLRSSELRGLPWSAVDFARKTVTVRQRADETGVIDRPKSQAGQRTIPMSPIVVNSLKEWKLACPQSALDLVFPSERGEVRGLSRIAQRFWYPLQRQAGLVDARGKPRFKFHALRHFAASLWIELGFSPKKLQALLGHSSIQMTFDVYGHLLASIEDDHERLARGEIGLIV
jgi:integrase